MGVLDLVRTASPDALLELDQVKDYLRVDHTDDDDMIEAMIEAAINHIDGYSGILGRALVTQTWRLCLPEFPGGSCWPARAELNGIRMPLLPLISVSEIGYVDNNGMDQVLDEAVYRVLDGPLAAVVPAYGETWPTTRADPRAVTITFDCGYGAPEDVPKAIVAAVKLMVGDLYGNRETTAAGIISEIPMSMSVQRLLQPFKVPRL